MRAYYKDNLDNLKVTMLRLKKLFRYSVISFILNLNIEQSVISLILNALYLFFFSIWKGNKYFPWQSLIFAKFLEFYV